MTPPKKPEKTESRPPLVERNRSNERGRLLGIKSKPTVIRFCSLFHFQQFIVNQFIELRFIHTVGRAVFFSIAMIPVAGVLIAHIVPQNTLSADKGETAVSTLYQPSIAVVRRVLPGADIAFHVVTEQKLCLLPLLP